MRIPHEMNLICYEERNLFNPGCTVPDHRIKAFICQDDDVATTERLSRRIKIASRDENPEFDLCDPGLFIVSKIFLEFFVLLGGESS